MATPPGLAIPWSLPEQPIAFFLWYFFFLLLFFFCREQEGGRKRRETSKWGRNTNQLPLVHAPDIALIRNWTGDLLLCRTTPNPLSHTGQGSLNVLIGYTNQRVPRFCRAAGGENLTYWRLYADLEVKLSFLPELEENPSLLWGLPHLFDVPLIDRVLCGSSPLFVGGHLIFLTESD